MESNRLKAQLCLEIGMEHLDRNELRTIQSSKLQPLLASVLAHNPFYQAKLSAVHTAAIDLQSYGRLIPFTTKHELVKDRLEHRPYGTGLTFPLEQYSRCHQTSGSTAVPIRWLDTKESWAALVDNWVRILRAAGITREDKFLFAFSFGPFLGFWTAIEAVHRLGNFCFPGGGMSSVARVQAILDNQITVLCCTPTYAQHLGEVAAQKGLSLAQSAVRLIIVAGEAGGSIPATRARIESLWPGATVFDHHGMTEVGPVSYQCPAQPGILHVLEHAYLAEVIEPGGTQPVPAGRVGELVLTTLDRIGSPLLRYRTGDLVEACPPARCRCGTWELALKGGIIGRADDMVVVRGVNVYPSLVEEIVRSHEDIGEYQVQVDTRGPMLELCVLVEPAKNDAPVDWLRKSLSESMQAALHLRVPIKCVDPGTLPRYEMKSRRWVRLTEGIT